MIISLFILSLCGLALCFYALTLEKKIQKDPEYKPACDINDMVSCSRTFLSPYGKISGSSPAKIGVIFYVALLFASAINLIQILFILSCMGIIASCVLAYIVYFKIKTLCLICTSVYIINIALFLISYSLCCR